MLGRGRRRLDETDIQKLSAITELSVMQIHNLLTMGLIHEQHAINALILYDYKRLKRRGKYRVMQIQQALAEKYNVNVSRIASVAYKKRTKRYYCEKCSKEISHREFLFLV